MFFNYAIVLEECNDMNKINYPREARAVIWQNDKLYMIQSDKGDYLFPGEEIEDDESIEESLKDMVRRKTGFFLRNIRIKLGEIWEVPKDSFKGKNQFQRKSEYYLCTIKTNSYDTIKTNSERGHISLDPYEKGQKYSSLWINIQEAINNNEAILKGLRGDINPWVYRETLVLKNLKEIEDILRSNQSTTKG